MIDSPMGAEREESSQGRDDSYAVVHLTVQDTLTDLIASQVVDHMAVQGAVNGRHRPAVIVVGLLEPVRHALRGSIRARVRELRARAPNVSVKLLPYVGRLGRAANAMVLARTLRRAVGRRPVVFHCRTESAVEWAVTLRPYFPRSGTVADIRGALPEEGLYARGFDTPNEADANAQRQYHSRLSELHGALSISGRIISVSPGMLDWLRELGVDEQRLVYVPCCVSAVSFTPHGRVSARAMLQVEGKLVFTYLGSITRYQHIEDGVLPFFRAARRVCPDAHLLCITNEPDRMKQLARSADIPSNTLTALSVPQREVASYLSASDCGLLLRAPAPINRLWQPTKLGEYLAAGVPVIVSRGVGTVDKLVEESGAGVAVDCFGVSDDALASEAGRVCGELVARGDTMRERALELCQHQFLWSSYVDRVRSAYREALAW